MYLGVAAHEAGELHWKMRAYTGVLWLTVLSRPDHFRQAPRFLPMERS